MSMVFRAIREPGEEQKYHIPFCDISFTTCFRLELLLIILEKMFSDKRDRMLELVYQNLNWAC
jgi:hypothetical protein